MVMPTAEYPAVATGLHIREAEEWDAEALAEYVAEIADERPNNTAIRRAMFPMAPDGIRDLIRRYQADDHSLFLVAELDGEIAGMMRVIGGEPPYRRHVVTLSINLRQDVRGLGLGKQLMHEALDWALSRPDILRIELEALSRNQAAIHFYERLGFQTEGTHHNMYRLTDENGAPFVDAVIMVYPVGDR